MAQSKKDPNVFVSLRWQQWSSHEAHWKEQDSPIYVGQLVDNFACLPFGAVALVNNEFIRALLLKNSFLLHLETTLMNPKTSCGH